MEFTVDRNELADAVTHAVHGVPGNPLQPVRAGMLIFSYDGGLSFTGSDGDVTFTSVIPYPASGESVVVPGKLFTDAVKSLPDTEVRFIKHDVNATLECGRTKFTFPVYKDEYPGLPEVASGKAYIDSDVFSDAIRKVIPACSRTDVNPALHAVRLEPDGDRLWVIGTDRYRLAAVRVPWTLTEPLEAGLLPSWAAEKFTRAALGDQVALGWDSRVVTLASGTQQLTSRVIAGTFPQWRRLLPESPCDVEVPAWALLAALRRAQIAAEMNDPVELIFTPGQVQVEAGFTNTAYDTVDASYQGDEFHVWFGIGYLIDGLAGCGETARFGFTTPRSPVRIESGAYTYTVLPRNPLNSDSSK